MARVNIREAKEADAKKIFELMQQQATEQNTFLPSHFTHEVLADGTWGPTAVVMAFVAESKASQVGELDGYILAHRAYAPWFGRALYIKDLYVVPAARRSGVATHLCRELMRAAVSMGCNQCDLRLHKENWAAMDLFEKLGAENVTVSEDWHIFNLDFKLMEMKSKYGGRGRLQIRLAVPEDMAGVMTMIQELADYENMSDAPQINAHTLVTDSPPQGTFFECFVAESDGALVGYAMFYPTFSHRGFGMCLEDFYVKPAHRGQGLGTAFMAQIAQHGVKLGGSHFEFVVLSWNTPTIAFYKNKGATDLTVDKGVQLYRFDDTAMRKCASAITH
ncbi:uncharacterized protein LOC123516901 [Portunus trituberculatus]|uniref:Diamine acetyltransferase 1 n=1 Tax=Portunus trituberculatus TaxID=210409 RepID=A0A5B7FJA2_PORTR|nr:uncharacterized protein LOC123516901 [Portunus trituberculatus]XP_045132587.1 uncharacterized protein LOC123516901 [Portunus trituberculatus]XP_045132588.1 uncharacterized protein LOC123516901 [Portunus trituberculatus]XP_045132589.1 uncharacterized protein LOC123516901 [Portunus trituberculatus]XP_045132590.1 uncharacterized protein LOC123516901 [Portunus trituberculatus]XP_045132591.1 uncharacterized protein LOC123516901 [Portunus trituberculatus]MPC44514.1 Diamine acetyltransferase 1 [P